MTVGAPVFDGVQVRKGWPKGKPRHERRPQSHAKQDADAPVSHTVNLPTNRRWLQTAGFASPSTGPRICK